MFKRSHILLSRFLAEQLQTEKIREHVTSLCIGSVEPDMSFRQRMKDHEFTQTWEDTKKRIRNIETMKITDKRCERAVCRQIGMVLHYCADYFTCPHNPSYGIGLIRHSFYEGRQAYRIRSYLRSEKAKKQFLAQKNHAEQMQSPEELFSYIEEMHDSYLEMSSHTPQEDCGWIVDACSVAAAVLAADVYGAA